VHGVKLDANRTTLQVEQLRSVVASLEEKVRDGRIAAPADGTLYALPVRVGDYVKVGDLLAEMADLHKVACALLLTSPNSVAWSPANLCASLGRASQSQLDGQNASHPQTSRGPRRPQRRRTSCEVNNDKLSCCPISM